MSSHKTRNSEEAEKESREEQLVVDRPQAKASGSVVPRLQEVIRREFSKELEKRERELEKIDDRLKEALQRQHLLRYAVVSSYYGVRTSMGEWPDASGSRQLVHPAISALSRKTKSKKSFKESCKEGITCDSDSQMEDKAVMEDESNIPTKIPRYIPPVMKKETQSDTSPTRGSHTKIKYWIIVGNVSRWIPVECREDGASHKWMVYARSPPNTPDMSLFVSKVRFFLHPSYRPFDVDEVKSPPFRLCRRGWGEFPIRVQVHFRNPLNKPIDVIHHLVLDRTKSGLQALGAETVVEGWLLADEELRNKCAQQQGSMREQNGITWEDSLLPDDRTLSNLPVSESGSGGMNSQHFYDYSIMGRRPRGDDGMPWSTFANSEFNECTLMKEEDIKKENPEELNFSDEEMINKIIINPHGSKESDVKKEFLGGESNVREEGFVADDESNGEGVISREESSDKGEIIPGYHFDSKDKFVHRNDFVVKEKITIQCDLEIKEEIVIEDGCFPLPSEGDTMADYSTIEDDSKKSGMPELQPEKSVGSGVQILTNEPVALRLQLSGEHSESAVHQKPTTSNTRQGPTKGVSLLMRTSNVRPGASLLIQNPNFINSARSAPLNKQAADPKMAMFLNNYKKLRKRVHADQEAAVNQLLNALPIVSLSASEPAYRELHPYSTDSLDIFFSWPVPKQRASEWLRAKEVRRLLLAQGFSEEKEEIWTTKDIVMWAQFHGYTPLNPKAPFPHLHHRPAGESSNVISNPITTFSELKDVHDFLSSMKDEKVSHQGYDDAEEIDVENIGSAPKKSSASGHSGVGLGARAAGGQRVVLLGMEPSLGDKSRMVDEVAREIGVVTSCPEEMIPYVFYPAAQRTLVEAVKSFMNELIRRSYGCALKRTSESSDESLIVKVEDIRMAVLARQEFDILTNEGLSAETDDSFKWDNLV